MTVTMRDIRSPKNPGFLTDRELRLYLQRYGRRTDQESRLICMLISDLMALWRIRGEDVRVLRLVAEAIGSTAQKQELDRIVAALERTQEQPCK